VTVIKLRSGIIALYAALFGNKGSAAWQNYFFLPYRLPPCSASNSWLYTYQLSRTRTTYGFTYTL